MTNQRFAIELLASALGGPEQTSRSRPAKPDRPQNEGGRQEPLPSSAPHERQSH